MNNNMIDCPALHEQSSHYPRWWNGKVPKRIKTKCMVTADFPMYLFPENKGLIARQGEEYPCWTNSHGAVSIVFPDGEQLGVKPNEFEIIEWH